MSFKPPDRRCKQLIGKGNHRWSSPLAWKQNRAEAKGRWRLASACVLGRVSFAVVKQNDCRKLLKRTGLTSAHTFISQSITEGSHCRISNRAGACRQELKQSHRGGLLTGLLGQLSYSAQDHMPTDGTAHINCQSRKDSRGLPTGQSGRGIFSVGVSSSQMTPACDSLT